MRFHELVQSFVPLDQGEWVRRPEGVRIFRKNCDWRGCVVDNASSEECAAENRLTSKAKAKERMRRRARGAFRFDGRDRDRERAREKAKAAGAGDEQPLTEVSAEQKKGARGEKRGEEYDRCSKRTRDFYQRGG